MAKLSAMSKTPKRPRDANQLAKLIVDLATGEVQEAEASAKVKATRSAGQLGGRSRAQALTPERRADIARLAAQARWKKAP